MSEFSIEYYQRLASAQAFGVKPENVAHFAISGEFEPQQTAAPEVNASSVASANLGHLTVGRDIDTVELPPFSKLVDA